VAVSCAGDGELSGRIDATPQPHPQVQMRTVPQGVGVNIHFYQGGEKDWQMIERAGIGIVRMDVSWLRLKRAAANTISAPSIS
jgi:hypothetical protein